MLATPEFRDDEDERQQNKRQFLAEQVLQKLEDAALPILLRLREKEFTLGTEDRLTFAGYVALTRYVAFNLK